ncbi:hypothetical protein BDV10DRAFT_87144 [Aspergillus recurvatus]
MRSLELAQNRWYDRLKRPLAYVEKALCSHLDDEFDVNIVRGQTQLRLSPATNIFLTSPEVVLAKMFSSELAFNPIHGTLTAPSGEFFQSQPSTGDALSIGAPRILAKHISPSRRQRPLQSRNQLQTPVPATPETTGLPRTVNI